MSGEASPPPEQEQMTEQETEGHVSNPDDSMLHHFMDNAFMWAGSTAGGLVLVALITVWGNKALKKRRDHD